LKPVDALAVQLPSENSEEDNSSVAPPPPGLLPAPAPDYPPGLTTAPAIALAKLRTRSATQSQMPLPLRADEPDERSLRSRTPPDVISGRASPQAAPRSSLEFPPPAGDVRSRFAAALQRRSASSAAAIPTPAAPGAAAAAPSSVAIANAVANQVLRSQPEAVMRFVSELNARHAHQLALARAATEQWRMRTHSDGSFEGDTRRERRESDRSHDQDRDRGRGRERQRGAEKGRESGGGREPSRGRSRPPDATPRVRGLRSSGVRVSDGDVQRQQHRGDVQRQQTSTAIIPYRRAASAPASRRSRRGRGALLGHLGQFVKVASLGALGAVFWAGLQHGPVGRVAGAVWGKLAATRAVKARRASASTFFSARARPAASPLFLTPNPEAVRPPNLAACRY
jgi:hypothetical protein